MISSVFSILSSPLWLDVVIPDDHFDYHPKFPTIELLSVLLLVSVVVLITVLLISRIRKR